jgi:hypothetical protein
MLNDRQEVLAMTATRIGLALLLAAVAGCSSKSSGSSPNNEESQNEAGGDDGGGPVDATTDARQTVEDSSPGGHDATSGDAAHSGDAASDAKSSDASGSSADSGAPADGGDAPAGQTGATAAYCATICSREATCLDAGADAGCQCETGSLVLYRSDYVDALTACESAAVCSELLQTDGGSQDAGLQGCANAVFAQITPTPAVTSFCAQAGDSICSEDAITDCPDQIKVYSDVTVSALASCVADSNCGDHTACFQTALTPPP